MNIDDMPSIYYPHLRPRSSLPFLIREVTVNKMGTAAVQPPSDELHSTVKAIG